MASAGAYAAMAGVALWCQQVLFADGAAFAYIAGLDEPWSLFWSDNPARVGSTAVTVFPVWLLRRVVPLGALGASLAYQVLILALPLPALALAWAWLPRGRRGLFVPIVAVAVGMGMTIFSFPTEVAVTAAAFWPLLCAALFPRPGARRLAAMVLLGFLFGFSHSLMILGVPVIVLAARLGAAGADSATRRWLAAALAVLVVLAVAALAVAALHQPANPLITRALAENGRQIAPMALTVLLHPAVASALILSSGLWLSVVRPDGRLWVVTIVVAAVVDAVYMVRLEALFLPALNYHARTIVAGALPVAGLGVLVMFRRGWSVPPVAGAALMVALLANMAFHEATFAGAWIRYRDALAETLAGPGPALVEVRRSRVVDLADRGDVAAGFLWSWVLPYQSLLIQLPQRQDRARVIVDADSWFVPFACGAAGGLARPDHVAPEAFRLFTDDICRRNPG